MGDDEVKDIHRTSIRILEEIGLHIPHEDTLYLLEHNGALIDWESQVARFPESLVQKAINGIKKDFKDAPAYFGKHIELDQGEFILWMCSEPEVVDIMKNEKRHGTHEDMMKGITIGNVLPNVGLIEPHGLPREAPSYLLDIYCFRYLYTYSRKPCSTWIYSAGTARYIIDMAKIIARKKNEKQLPLIYFAETISPLKYAPHTLEIMKLMAENNAQINIGPMVTTGGSGPVTLAGTIALENAEVLSLITLVWLRNPEQALVYPGISSALDMKTALISYGSPEQALLPMAAVQMAKHYGMGCCCNIHLSDSNTCDFQRGYEAAATAAFALASGVEMIGTVGYSGAGFMATNPGCQSLEQLIIDNECADYLKRILRGFEINEETLAFELIREVGIGGTFMDKLHTVEHMKEELFFSDLFNRDPYNTWQDKGATTIAERAHVRLKELLDKHYPPEPVIDRNTEKLLEEIYQEASAHIPEN